MCNKMSTQSERQSFMNTLISVFLIFYNTQRKPNFNLKNSLYFAHTFLCKITLAFLAYVVIKSIQLCVLRRKYKFLQILVNIFLKLCSFIFLISEHLSSLEPIIIGWKIKSRKTIFSLPISSYVQLYYYVFEMFCI